MYSKAVEAVTTIVSSVKSQVTFHVNAPKEVVVVVVSEEVVAVVAEAEVDSVSILFSFE
jgi:hypothetical protein